MNYSYNQFHLANSYGVFGSVTKTRYELVIEGTSSDTVNEVTKWHEYEIPCKLIYNKDLVWFHLITTGLLGRFGLQQWATIDIVRGFAFSAKPCEEMKNL